MDIQEILNKYKFGKKEETSIKSERAELNKKFVDKLNASRIEAKLKPLPASFYCIKMAQSGLKTNHDLYWFYSYCNEANNFSKCWWWALNSKNVK